MKFNCGLTDEEKRAQANEQADKIKALGWHKVFAWFPIRVGHRDCRWLEYVEQRSIDYSYNWGHIMQYRAIDKLEENK